MKQKIINAFDELNIHNGYAIDNLIAQILIFYDGSIIISKFRIISNKLDLLTKFIDIIPAYYLRSAIVSGQFADGSALVIDRLASDLGVSHTPIREAIRRLEAEGFLVYAPRKGATVRQVSRSEFDQLVEIRKALEPVALVRAIEMAGDGGFDAAHMALANWKKKQEPARVLEAQWAFFWALYSPSGQNRILELISTNWKHIQRYHQISWINSKEIRQQDLQLKSALLKACQNRSVEESMAALDNSICWGKSLVDAKISQIGQG